MGQKYLHDHVGAIEDACRVALEFDKLAGAAKEFFRAHYTAPNSENAYLAFDREIEGTAHSFTLLTPFGKVRADYSLNASAPRKYFGKLDFVLVPESDDAPLPAPFYGFVFDRQGYASLNLTPDQDWNLMDNIVHMRQRVARSYALQILGSLADTV